MGVKVTLRRTFDDNKGVISRTFDEADDWGFDEGTLLILDNSGDEGRRLVEFPVDVVESVEFV